MYVLVAGGAGFIGSHVAEHLLERGHEVAVVDDLSTGRRENVPEWRPFLRGGRPLRLRGGLPAVPARGPVPPGRPEGRSSLGQGAAGRRADGLQDQENIQITLDSEKADVETIRKDQQVRIEHISKEKLDRAVSVSLFAVEQQPEENGGNEGGEGTG